MSPAIEAMCTEALARLVKQINRSAGQHARAVRRAFASAHSPPAESTNPQQPTNHPRPKKAFHD